MQRRHRKFWQADFAVRPLPSGLPVSSMGLENFSDFIQFVKITCGNFTKVDARLGAVLDESFGFKSKQCLANRTPAEVEFFGEQPMRQTLAGPHVAIKQKTANLRVGIVAN